MKKQQVRTFKTTPIIEQNLDALVKQLNMNKSKIIKMAISQLAVDAVNWEEGT